MPHHVEQAETRLVVRGDLDADQALLGQRLDDLPGLAGDGLDGLDRAAAAEDRQPAEQALLGRIQKGVAPVDRVAQGLVAVRPVTRAAAEQVER